jgi:DNA-binding NarL/FixJ family response regulator
MTTAPPESPTGRSVRVLVVDDQKIVREGLVMLLGLLPDLDVVGTASDGEEAVRQVAALSPDIVLMDLNMPRCNGVEATERLREAHPATRVVVLTTYADDRWVFSALQAGARGFLTKDAGPEEIQRAIVAVASGQAQLDPSVQRRLLDALAHGASLGVPTIEEQQRLVVSDPAAAPDGLTPRETEVLRHIAAGESNQEIAAALFVSEATVKTHVNHIFAKTGLRDRAQLVAYGFRHGLAVGGS